MAYKQHLSSFDLLIAHVTSVECPDNPEFVAKVLPSWRTLLELREREETLDEEPYVNKFAFRRIWGSREDLEKIRARALDAEACPDFLAFLTEIHNEMVAALETLRPVAVPAPQAPQPAAWALPKKAPPSSLPDIDFSDI